MILTINKKSYAKNQVMSTKGRKIGGVLTIVNEGELKLDYIGQHTMTIKEAIKLHKKGLAVSVA